MYSILNTDDYLNGDLHDYKYLVQLSYRDIQVLAKQRGIPANKKKEDIIAAIILSANEIKVVPVLEESIQLNDIYCEEKIPSAVPLTPYTRRKRLSRSTSKKVSHYKSPEKLNKGIHVLTPDSRKDASQVKYAPISQIDDLESGGVLIPDIVSLEEEYKAGLFNQVCEVVSNSVASLINISADNNNSITSSEESSLDAESNCAIVEMKENKLLGSAKCESYGEHLSSLYSNESPYNENSSSYDKEFPSLLPSIKLFGNKKNTSTGIVSVSSKQTLTKLSSKKHTYFTSPSDDNTKKSHIHFKSPDITAADNDDIEGNHKIANKIHWNYEDYDKENIENQQVNSNKNHNDNNIKVNNINKLSSKAIVIQDVKEQKNKNVSKNSISHNDKIMNFWLSKSNSTKL